MRVPTSSRLYRLRIVTVAVLLAGASGAIGQPASAPAPTDTLRQLVESGQYAEAYQLGSSIQLDYEGATSFDFFFGLAALETGNYRDAAFALERAAITRPDQARIRLELGRAFFLTNDFAAARAQFQSVLDESPPQAVRDNIQAYFVRMEELEKGQVDNWSFFVETASGYDDNINSATGVGSIDTPFGNFALTEDGQAQEDNYASISGAMQYKQALSRTSSVDVGLFPSYRANFDGSTFDIGALRLETGYSQTDGATQWRIGARAQVVTVDAERFQDAYGVVGSLTRDFGDGLFGTISGTATTLRFDGDRARDTDQYVLALGLGKQMGQFVHSLTVYGAREPAREDDIGEHNGKQFFGGSYGIQWALSRSFVPFLTLAAQSTEHDEDHPVFAETREDDQYSARVGFQWLAMPRLVIRGEYRYTDVGSNLDVFEFDRNEIEAGIRYTF